LNQSEQEVNPVRKGEALNPTLNKEWTFFLYPHHKWWGFLRGESLKSTMIQWSKNKVRVRFGSAFFFLRLLQKKISLMIQSGVGGSNPSEGFKLKINLFPLIF
jgi:hypothetical protein